MGSILTHIGSTPLTLWTRGELRQHLSQASLDVVTVRGAIHYPPSATVARLLAPVDPWLSRARLPGAAFLVASARRPLEVP